MQLPEFLFCENKSDLPGAGLILCTESPFFFGQVMKGLSLPELIDYTEKHKAVAGSKIHGYKIGVIIIGALHSSLFISDFEKYAKDSARLGRLMSDFYFEEKIKNNLKYYARYREDS